MRPDWLRPLCMRRRKPLPACFQEPTESSRSTGARIRVVPIDVCGGGVALLRRQRALNLLFYSDVGGEWPDTGTGKCSPDRGGITRRGLSSAGVHGLPVTCNVFASELSARPHRNRRAQPREPQLGPSDCVENHLKRQLLSHAANLAGASWFYSACQFASLEAREDDT